MFKRSRVARWAVTGLALSLTVLGLTMSLSSAGASTASKYAASKNWTIKLANVTTGTPTYAYPFIGPSDFTVSNVSWFQYLMYRPLYWFGNTTTGAVQVNEAESLASLPKMSNGNKTATITLKSGYKWSNGEPVQANDVMEFLNLFASEPSGEASYAKPVKGVPVTIPDLFSSVTAPNTHTIVMNFIRPVSPSWLLNNPLSEVTPLPKSWDIMDASWKFTTNTAAGYTASTVVTKAGGNLATTPGGCWSSKFIGDGNKVGPTAAFADQNGLDTIVPKANAAQAEKCQEVVATMNSFANDVVDYAKTTTDTGKIWGTSDGPWKLTSYDSATSSMSWGRNPSFGGPKAYAKALDYIPCQSETGDCYNLLLNGTVSATYLVGVPAADLPPITSLSQVTKSQDKALASKYDLSVSYEPVIGYSPLNFASTNTGVGEDSAMTGDTTPRGALLSQPYIVKALNDSYPVKAIVNDVYRGYGYSTYGPIPPYPPSNYTSLKSSPYALSKVAGEMTPHGWSKVNGIYTCEKPGTGASECGAKILKGATMTFRADGAVSGIPTAQAADEAWVSAAKGLGINIILKVETFDAVISADTSASTSWDLYTGSGWEYAPDYYPSGEDLWLTGDPENVGSYNNATANKDIMGTLSGSVSMNSYENFMVNNAPVIWNYWNPYTDEHLKNIGGFVEEDTANMNPELWYLKG
ncbi:MAG: ABC transporter substrate-binding protein [Acidimicrobiales bacterium]|jgi:peptide/nickel transport system substrate-binding protein